MEQLCGALVMLVCKQKNREESQRYRVDLCLKFIAEEETQMSFLVIGPNKPIPNHLEFDECVKSSSHHW